MPTLTLPTFNPLQFANRLKAVGVPEQQAETEAEALREAFDTRDQALVALEKQISTQQLLSEKEAEQLATKADVFAVKTEVLAEVFAVKADVIKLDAKIELVRKDMVALSNQLVIRLSAVMVTLIGLLIAASKWL